MSNYLPWYLSYSIAAATFAILSGGALLYHYQCEIIYPANFPEGSRKNVGTCLLVPFAICTLSFAHAPEDA